MRLMYIGGGDSERHRSLCARVMTARVIEMLSRARDLSIEFDCSLLAELAEDWSAIVLLHR